MAKKKSLPVTDSHRYLFTCISKITAYVRVGKLDDAKAWARAVVKHLQKEGLLDENI